MADHPASTQFVDNETTVYAEWLNALDDVVLKALQGKATPSEIRAVIDAAPTNHSHPGDAPVVHTHTAADLTDEGQFYAKTKGVTLVDAAGTIDVVYGSAASTACAGNDARLSDSRVPTIHAPSHQSGGSDAIKLDELAAPTDVTALNATTGAHGLLRKLSGTATQFLDGNGGWTVPAGGAATQAFGTITVAGQSDVVADTAPDTLTLVAGTGIALTTNAATDAVTITNAGALSGRNKLINGNFDVWQRGTTLASGTGDRYLADRWVVGSGGSTYTYYQNIFGLGLEVNQGRYYPAVAVTSVAGAANFCSLSQRIESVRSLNGKTATLSFWASADAAKPITVELVQSFGTGGSPSASVTGIGSTKINLTTGLTQYTVTVALPSVSGKTIGSNSDDYLRVTFWLDAGSSFDARTQTLGQRSGIYLITGVQLEEGSVATSFELRPLGAELALCQRYYQKHLGVASGGYGSAGGFALTDFSFPVWLRIAPAVAFTATSYTNASALATNAVYAGHIRMVVTVTVAGLGWAVTDIALDAEL